LAYGLWRLLRPSQWIKNGFVLAPLLFSGLFGDPQAVFRAFFAAFLFCAASSTVYIVNDICDVEKDRLHPKKMHRPIASGIVRPAAALWLASFLVVVQVAGFFYLREVFWVIVAYVLLNVLYTVKLKTIPVVDIFVVATSFVLRVFAGGRALDVPVSAWMFVTTLSLALFLASIKRRQELSLMGSEGRAVLKNYSVELVNRYAQISATGALVFYSLFVMSARPELVATIPVVLFGIFRYWYIVDSLGRGESPTEALLGDGQLLATVALWIIVCGYLLVGTVH
jgi:4-hydroxybenzoate polyprenyltransferase